MSEAKPPDAAGAKPFRRLSFFAKAPAVVVEGADAYVPGATTAGLWPAPTGGAAQNSRAGEPLLFDHWHVAWQAPLGEASEPDGLVVGRGGIVVNGRRLRRLFSLDGRPLGHMRRGAGTCLLDDARGRLLADDASGGLYSHHVADGAAEARIMLAAPGDMATVALLEGPGVLVLVSARESPFGPPPQVIVQTVRVRDYASSKDGIHYGIEPLAGIIREIDGDVRAAAASTGPVFATRDGLLFCDWQLRPLAEQRLATVPLALSVDGEGRACLLSRDQGVARLRVVPPAGPVLADLELPWRPRPDCAPPVVAADGRVLAVAPEAVVALAPTGELAWTDVRGATAPATVTSNGLVLLCDEQLVAVTADGRRQPLWRPPARVTTATVLAGGRLHVATADTLFVLEPG